MHIGFVIEDIIPDHSINSFGGYNYLGGLWHRLKQRGVDIVVFGFGQPESFPYHYVSLGEQAPRNDLAKLFAVNLSLKRVEAELNMVDIIHSTSWASIPILTRIIGKKDSPPFLLDSRPPLFGHVNNWRLFRYQIHDFYKWLILHFFHPTWINFCDLPSKEEYQHVFSRTNCSYIPVPIDIKQFSTNHHIRSTRTRILFANGLRYAKGVVDLLEALKIVWESAPDVELQIAGDGPLRSTIERLALSDIRITYLGCIPNEQMPQVLQQADAFVLPSYIEGFSRSVLEAMASGLPIITTNSGGMGILKDKGVGSIISSGQVNLLAQEILNLVTEEDFRLEAGKRGQSYVETYHDWDKVIEQMVLLYQQLQNQRN